ncbi:MAG: hypothetical protein F6K01_08890 [Okeania sp. SIO1I7]|nr:hypothetical protein [Okeania sp. SIO1I7]
MPTLLTLSLTINKLVGMFHKTSLQYDLRNLIFFQNRIFLHRIAQVIIKGTQENLSGLILAFFVLKF